MNNLKTGQNCIIGNNTILGENITIGHNCIIEDNVVIGKNSHIDSNTIIRSNTQIDDNAFIGSNCIIGEYWVDFCLNRQKHEHPLLIGKNALIRSGSIIYAGSKIGDSFQTGHRATIREKTHIGDHVSVGTLTDIQGNCTIGNYVRLHSNVHIGQLSTIDDFVWIFPYSVLTNDPTPPSEHFKGVHIKPFAIIATNSIIMPGMTIEQDALVAAGSIVTKSVTPYAVVAGNPAKPISDIRKVKNKITGETVYPWRHHFKHYMPWEESDFLIWYASLDFKEKQHYKIDKLIETPPLK